MILQLHNHLIHDVRISSDILIKHRPFFRELTLYTTDKNSDSSHILYFFIYGDKGTHISSTLQHFPINFCIIPAITTIPTTKTAASPLLFSLTANR